MRLQGQDHARFQLLMAGGHEIGFLLMPPGAHAMADERDPLRVAVLTKLLLGKLDGVLGHPAYNYYLHTAPARSAELPHYHWHLEIVPRTARPAGFEWSTGCFINAVLPETAAEELRTTEPPPDDDIFGP